MTFKEKIVAKVKIVATKNVLVALVPASVPILSPACMLKSNLASAKLTNFLKLETG